MGATGTSLPTTVHVRYGNDSFALRQPLIGTNLTVSICNFGASLEPGEPVVYSAEDATVWYTWTAPVSGPVLFSLPGHDFSPFAAVFTGKSLANLTFVAGSPAGFSASYEAVQGVSYQIAVGGYDYSDATGHATLQWQSFPAFTNDDFVNASVIDDSTFDVEGNNVNATAEPGENSMGYSVWWRWTATTNGQVQISAPGMNVSVYLGDSVSNLTSVTGSGSGVGFNAATGVTYNIAVDSGSGASFDFNFEFVPGPKPPANDNFTNSITLVGNDLTFSGTTVGATREFGEPGTPGSYNFGSGSSIWWSWTAPSTGELNIGADQRYAWIGVFTGSSVDQLTNVGSSFTGVGLAVTAGVTYRIMLDTANGNYATTLTLSFLPSITDLSNDNFADAAVLEGQAPQVFESNAGATKEPGEPNHGNNPGGQSVWFSWTAPSSRMAQIQVAPGNGLYPLLGVYWGTNLTNLVILVILGEAGFASPSYTEPIITVPVTNGMNLDIAVNGYNGDWGVSGADGTFTLEVKLTPSPANDLFINRARIVGTNATVSVSNFAASSEPNEPGLGLAPSARTVWWTWTAPESGIAIITSAGTSFSFPLIGVYTGNSLTNLALVAEGNKVQFAVQAGTAYQIQADGQSGAWGQIVLNLSMLPPESNDNFSNRIALTGGAGSVSGANFGATVEPNEPALVSFEPGAKSVWWTWTATNSTSATFGITGNFEWLKRTGLAKSTNTRIEKGDPAVGLGAYAMALFVLGFGEALGNLTDARRDDEGLLMDEERLPKRVRLKKAPLAL